MIVPLMFLQTVLALPAVPAIQEEYGNLGNEWCDLTCTWHDAKPKNWSPFDVTPHRRKRWTCEDKRRVLMQTEDGQHFCVLFDVKAGAR